MTLKLVLASWVSLHIELSARLGVHIAAGLPISVLQKSKAEVEMPFSLEGQMLSLLLYSVEHTGQPLDVRGTILGLLKYWDPLQESEKEVFKAH